MSFCAKKGGFEQQIVTDQKGPTKSGFGVSRTTIIRSCVISLCKTMQDHSAIPFLGVEWVQAQGCVSRLVRCAGNALGSLAALHVHTVPRRSFEVGKNLSHSLGSTILMEST